MNDQKSQTKSFGDLVCVYNRFYVFNKHSNYIKRDSHFYFNLFQKKTRSGALFSDRNSREAYNYGGGKNPIIVDIESDTEQQMESRQIETKFKSEQKPMHSEFEQKMKDTSLSQTREDRGEKAEIAKQYNFNEDYQNFLNKIISKQLSTQINASVGNVNDLVLEKFNPDYNISKMTESGSIQAVCLLQDEGNQSENTNLIPVSELESKNAEKLMEESKEGHEIFGSPTEIAKTIIYELIQNIEEKLIGNLNPSLSTLKKKLSRDFSCASNQASNSASGKCTRWSKIEDVELFKTFKGLGKEFSIDPYDAKIYEAMIRNKKKAFLK